jgi:hypothetical protein
VTSASSLLREVAHVRAQVDQIEATRPADLDSVDRLRRDLASRRAIPFARSRTPKQSALLDRICGLIADECLPGVSSPVRAKFVGALHAWHLAQEASIDDARYVSQFASMARALTHPEEVLQALNDAAVREL